jgi:hypothetical protein
MESGYEHSEGWTRIQQRNGLFGEVNHYFEENFQAAYIVGVGDNPNVIAGMIAGLSDEGYVSIWQGGKETLVLDVNEETGERRTYRMIHKEVVVIDAATGMEVSSQDINDLRDTLAETHWHQKATESMTNGYSSFLKRNPDISSSE